METAKTSDKDLQVREKQQVTREPGTHEGAYFEPPVDIYETDDAIVLSGDLPGVEASDVQTDLKDNLLTITARVRGVDPRWKTILEEYTIGNYVRQFRLGQQIDQSKITAQLKDGVLILTMPKAEAAKPRRIQISG